MTIKGIVLSFLLTIFLPATAFAQDYSSLTVVPRHGAQYHGFGNGKTKHQAQQNALRKCNHSRCIVAETYKPGECALIVLAERQIFWDKSKPSAAERRRRNLLKYCQKIDDGCKVIIHQCN